MSKERRGIQSIEVGGRLLDSLVRHGQPMMLKDLARDAGMSPAKAHPYLVSFGKLGLIEQDLATGRYELGPFALQMGLIRLERTDPVRLAMPAVVALAAEIGHAVALAVWGSHGATVLQIEEANRQISVNMRPGTVLSPIGSATGRVFTAFLPAGATAASVDRDFASGQPTLPTRAALADILADIRRDGMARIEGSPIPGINALSAPVFEHGRGLVLVITALGPAATFDVAPDGTIARALAATAARLSRQLGYDPALKQKGIR